jgi:mRNA interferase MazF
VKEGDIAKATLDQSDGLIKFRPVVLLKQLPPSGDWLVCGVTSSVKYYVKDFDILIKEEDEDFSDTGLLKSSIIRLGFLGIIPEKEIEESIGYLNIEKYKVLISNLLQSTSN